MSLFTPVQHKVGAPPGMLVAPPGSPPPVVDVTVYNTDRCERTRVSDLKALPALVQQDAVVWVDVNGLGDADFIGELGDLFGFHRLSLEDVLNLAQRPKVDVFDDCLYLVTQYPLFNENADFEQISLFVKGNLVVSFQAYQENRLEKVLRRVEQGKGRIRKAGADYLLYALLDVCVDAFFPVLEAFDRRLEEIEDTLEGGSARTDMHPVFQLRRNAFLIRRTMWAVREMADHLQSGELEQICESTRPFFRDAHDHCLRVVEVAEMQREMCMSLVELQQSVQAQKMNEVMKVLTIIATLFIPLTFLAGIYGMNFNPDASPWNMPELNFPYAYPLFWVVMVSTAVAMLLFFRRKGWLGGGE